ncbi:MAG: hypothetical protein LAO06_10625 [Acidobacteriia bacterium]|nr:hypothetical protein [Terriglobia bacterium]
MSSATTGAATKPATDGLLVARSSARPTCVFGLVMVLVAYSIPLLLGLMQSGRVPNLLFEDEAMYAVRVLDAYRGGDLANPYLVGHQHAPRFMPGFAERTIALAARLLHVPPLTAIALSRVVIPLLIFTMMWLLARVMGLPPLAALLAGLVSVLAPSTRTADHLHFLRYLRVVSPGANVLLLTIALYFWMRAYKKPTTAAAVLAGILTAALFYTPPYYWIFLLAGAWVLTLISPAPARRCFLIALAIAILLGAPALYNAIRLSRLPEVQQTLHRLDLMTLGRRPDPFVLRHFAIAIAAAAVLCFGRRRLAANATFLLAFFVPGALLLLQNVVTNRRLQSDHWIECLIPVAALAFTALLSGSVDAGRSPRLLSAAIGVLIAVALTSQTVSYFQWKTMAERDPLYGVVAWLLEPRMPRTLAWLDAHTPPRSIVVTPFGDVLPMFTHNAVYFAGNAAQHVISDRELQRRRDSAEQFDPAHPAPLPYPADYYLGLGERCAAPALPVLYRNPAEGACVLDLRGQH